MTRDYYYSNNGTSLRIACIHKATVNGRKVKLFMVSRFSPVANAFVFEGQYSVPQRTANKNIGPVFLRDGAHGEPHA